MGNTLVDEPLPPTQSEPPAGDRPTIDDVPPPRRGASPTLIDGPPQAVPGQRRGASPTLPDVPPHTIPTPPLAPLHAAPIAPAPAAPIPAPGTGARGAPTPPAGPLMAAPIAPAFAAPVPQPIAAPVPQPVPQPVAAQVPVTAPVAAPAQAAAPAPVTSPVPAPAPMPAASPAVGTPPAGPVLLGAAAEPPSRPLGGLPPAPPPDAPGGGAPPPLAYPRPGAHGAGFLAQIPSMPPARAALPAGAVRAAEAAPGAEELDARAALPPPAPLAPSPAQAPIESPQPAAPGAAPAGDASHAAPRLAPGSRTLLGVAPGSPAQGGSHNPYPNQAQPAAEGAPGAPSPAGTPGPGGALANGQNANGQNANGHGPDGQSADGQPAAAPRDDRPTELDPADGAAAPAAQAPSKSRARTAVAVIFAVLGVLGIAAVVIGYFVLVRYTPLAARHIPAASNLAVRADVRQIGTFEPVRKHVISALLDRPSEKAGKTLADRVTEATGINPALDVREIIVASVDSKSWVALVGGSFKPGKFVPGMEKVLHDEGRAEWHRAGELLVGPTGIALGQADDGTLVLGTEAEIVTAALPSSEEYKRMDLPKEGALSFAVSKEAFEELARDTGAFDPNGSLRRIRHLKGTLALGAAPSVDIDLEPKGGENADALAKDVETFLGRLRLGLVLVPDQMGEKTALSEAKITVENGEVMVRGPWPMEGLDRACQKLATLLGVK